MDALRRVRLLSEALGGIVTESSSYSFSLIAGEIGRPFSSSSSSIASVASPSAVLSPHPLQRLPSEVSIVTACMQASHPSTRAYPLAAGLGHPSVCSRSLPRRSSTSHHHVSYRRFSSGNAEYATKAEMVNLEHKVDLIKLELESKVELLRQENKQIETLFEAHKEKTRADVKAGENAVLKTYVTVLSTVVTVVVAGVVIHEFMNH